MGVWTKESQGLGYGKSEKGLLYSKKRRQRKLDVKHFHNTHKQMYITDITDITVNSYENASPTPLPKKRALENYDK